MKEIALIDYIKIFASFTVSKLLLLFTLFFLIYMDNGELSVTSLINCLKRWDSGWYLSIANNGYSLDNGRFLLGESNFAFFPALPLLTKAFSLITNLSNFHAGILLVNTSFLLSTFLLFKIVFKLSQDLRVAHWAVLFLLFSPGAIYFTSYYTESLFILFALSFYLSFINKHYILAGLFGALLTATRSNGLLIGIFPLYALISSILSDLKSERILIHCLDHYSRLILCGLLIPLGQFSFWYYCYIKTGDAFIQKTLINYGWGWEPSNPFSNVLNSLISSDFRYVFSASIFFVICIPLVLLIKERRYDFFLFCFINIVLFYSGGIPSSQLRYSITLFPIYYIISYQFREKTHVQSIFLVSSWTLNLLIIYAWYKSHNISV